MEKEEGSTVFHVDKETREAMKTGTNPTITKMLEEMKKFRDRSNCIFPEYP